MYTRMIPRSLVLRAPHLKTSLSRVSPLLARFAHETPADFRVLEFQNAAREAERISRQQEQQQLSNAQITLKDVLAYIDKITEDTSNSKPFPSAEEVEEENRKILKEHCKRYAEPPLEYILRRYEAHEEEGYEILDEPSLPPSEFDEELVQAIADETDPEPTENILTNSAWIEHRATNITNEADLIGLLDTARSQLALIRQNPDSSVSKFDQGFYGWLLTIAEASESRWKGCFETITVMHAPEELKRHFTREGLESVYRNPVRREMALSLAERYSSWAVEEDEYVHRFSTWPKVNF